MAAATSLGVKTIVSKVEPDGTARSILGINPSSVTLTEVKYWLKTFFVERNHSQPRSTAA
jgi:hypothetical protein